METERTQALLAARVRRNLGVSAAACSWLDLGCALDVPVAWQRARLFLHHSSDPAFTEPQTCAMQSISSLAPGTTSAFTTTVERAGGLLGKYVT